MDEHNILLGEIAEPEDCVPVGAAEESNDDGIESFAGTDFVDELYTDGGDFDEHGVKTALEAQARDGHLTNGNRIDRFIRCQVLRISNRTGPSVRSKIDRFGRTSQRRRQDGTRRASAEGKFQLCASVVCARRHEPIGAL
ncbi:hypothetical protein FPOAC2_13743 [Fusarium poae]